VIKPRKKDWKAFVLFVLFIAAGVVSTILLCAYQERLPVYDNMVSSEPDFDMVRRPDFYSIRSIGPCVGLIEVLDGNGTVVGKIDPAHPDNVGERCSGQVRLKKGLHRFRVVDRSPDVRVVIWVLTAPLIPLKWVMNSGLVTLIIFGLLIISIRRTQC
jgi:hypothetical protein